LILFEIRLRGTRKTPELPPFQVSVSPAIDMFSNTASIFRRLANTKIKQFEKMSWFFKTARARPAA
jgi:hypothetical protein